jgi:hypothetical protein
MQASLGPSRGGPSIGIEPIPLLQLPFLVPELVAEIELLRVAVYNLVESRRKLLEDLESCRTLEELKRAIKETYLESARQEVADGLKHRHTPQFVLEDVGRNTDR